VIRGLGIKEDKKNYQYNNLAIEQFSNRKGFSLIEVIAALTIMALIVGGMLGIIWQGFAAGRNSQQRTVAYSLARAILEEYSNWTRLDGVDGTFDGWVNNGNYTDDLSIPNPDSLSPITINNITYTPALTISNGPSYPNDLKQFDVNISWGTENYSLTTLKANY